MRINKFVALATGVSRREADRLIESRRIRSNGTIAALGYDVQPEDTITLDGDEITKSEKKYVLLNKPTGVVTSRKSQRGDRTIYSLIPDDLQELKPVGRLDKDSSGLLLLTNDGDFSHRMTHPTFHKMKYYDIELDAPLSSEDMAKIESGVVLDDGASAFQLSGKDNKWTVSMHEGRNRQIRRTFKALGYTVTKLHRTKFGNYDITMLDNQVYKVVKLL